MNALHWILAALAIVFVALLPLSRKAAGSYARFALLAVAGTIMLMPFVWLVCAAFKDKAVLNEYTFLPPPAKISTDTINLDNFRTLLAIIPPALLFFALQREFISGLTSGAVKG